MINKIDISASNTIHYKEVIDDYCDPYDDFKCRHEHVFEQNGQLMCKNCLDVTLENNTTTSSSTFWPNTNIKKIKMLKKKKKNKSEIVFGLKKQ